MAEELNQNFSGRSSTAKMTPPYLHRVLSHTGNKKYVNWLCKQYTSDEALAALAYEYYRLASLPKLNEYNSQKMLLILSFAEIDVTLSHFINAIDAFLATELSVNDAVPDETVTSMQT